MSCVCLIFKLPTLSALDIHLIANSLIHTDLKLHTQNNLKSAAAETPCVVSLTEGVGK